MSEILVWAPTAGHTFELLSKARELATAQGAKVVALAVGPTASSAKHFIAHGADVVLHSADAGYTPVQVEPYAALLLEVIKARKPGIVLIGDGVRSRDVAAFVSAKLGVGCGAQWNGASLEGGRLVGGRSFYSGRSILTERLTKDPQVATLVDRVFEPLAADTAREGAVEELATKPAAPKAKLASHEEAKTEGTSLEEAPVVVSAGRGIKKKEDLAMAEELAGLLDGAVGCTRPIAADLKWLGDEHWIGLSGHKIKPKAYIGLGVSGQIQHVTGMRGSKLIIAINKDEEAPLVKISDYAVVDDLYKVVPELIKAIKALKSG